MTRRKSPTRSAGGAKSPPPSPPSSPSTTAAEADAMSPPPPPASPPAPSKSRARKPELTGTFLLNVTSILTLVVVVVTWMATVTQAFSEIGMLWALAGLAAWLAFFKQLIPEARIRKIRGAFTDTVLDHPRTWWFVGGTLVLFVFVTSFVGVLEIRNGEGPPRSVLVYGPDEKLPIDEPKETIIQGQPMRRLCWVGWGGRTWNAKVDGLPTAKVTVDPWWLSSGSEKYLVPWDFARPVVLIAPGAAEANIVKPGESYTLVVTITEKPRPPVSGEKEEPPKTRDYWTGEKNYHGGLVWIGCEDTSVAIPDGLANRRDWDQVLNQSDVLNRPAQVVFPVNEGDESQDTPESQEPPRLEPGQRITARIKRDGQIVYTSDLLFVAKVRSDGSFVQALLVNRQD